MECLAENEHMQQLARKFDAELSFDFGTDPTFRILLLPGCPARRLSLSDFRFLYPLASGAGAPRSMRQSTRTSRLSAISFYDIHWRSRRSLGRPTAPRR
jgi:hypothetical protein